MSETSREGNSTSVNCVLQLLLDFWSGGRGSSLVSLALFCFLSQEACSTLSLFTQVDKWVPVIIMLEGGGGGGVTLWWTSIPSMGVAIFPVASCYRNQSYVLALMGHLARKLSLPFTFQTCNPTLHSNGVLSSCAFRGVSGLCFWQERDSFIFLLTVFSIWKIFL